MYDNTFLGIKRFLVVVLSFQIAVLALLGLDALNLGIPFLTQLIGFIYLTFIPGIIILRIINLRELGFLKTLVFSSALSIAFLLITGLLMNSLYPYLGISAPLSLFSMVTTISALTMGLCLVAYLRDRKRLYQAESNRKRIPVPSFPVLFLILLPLLSVLGTQIVNNYNNNVLLLVMLGLVGIVPVIVSFTDVIPERLHPLAVASVALSLVYHHSLISNYIVGFDIHTEYQLANQVLLNARWDPNIAQTYNSALSITILPSIYAYITHLSLTWVFKAIYPLFLMFSALATYEIGFSITRNSKIGFLSAFFMMAVNVFYTVLPEVAKQEVAYLFMGAIALIMIDKSIPPLPKRILAMVFVTGLIVSHYSMAFIFLGAAIFVQLLLLSLFILKRILHIYQVRGGSGEPDPLNRENSSTSFHISNVDVTGDLMFVVFTFVIAVSWYMYQSGGAALNGAVFIIRDIVANISEMFSPKTSEALSVITTTTVSPVHEALKYIHLFTQFLIGLGIADLFIRWRRKALDGMYSLFSFAYFILLIAALILPYVASAILTTRLYHITLLFLAPFCIFGCLSIFRLLTSKTYNSDKIALRFMSLVLAVFLLLNTGFIFELLRDHPSSVALSRESVVKYNDQDSVAFFYSDYTAEQEVFSARWFSSNAPEKGQVYANSWQGYDVHPLTSYGMVPLSRMWHLDISLDQLIPGNYVYLGYGNTVYGLADRQEVIIGSGNTTVVKSKESKVFNIKELAPLLDNIDLVYSNGGSKILFVPADK